jgi:formamidopyrimidine-DNA glycosylase
MLELPEAAVLAVQIKQTLAGRRITRATAGHSPHKFAWYSGDPAEYNDRLAGKRIVSATPYGGTVEMQVNGWLLVISTALRYHPAGELRPKKHQLLLEFDDGSAASATVQMWGGLFCFPAGELGGEIIEYQSARQKPSPLSADFDQAYFDQLFTEDSGKLSVKAFLATEQRIPGLGNGVLQDILWKARIHPKRKIADLDGEELERLYAAIKSVLNEMTAQGGRDTERDLFGNPGGYQTILSKNTVDTPCPTCGTLIRKEAYLGGSIYVCESCQGPGR